MNCLVLASLLIRLLIFHHLLSPFVYKMWSIFWLLEFPLIFKFLLLLINILLLLIFSILILFIFCWLLVMINWLKWSMWSLLTLLLQFLCWFLLLWLSLTKLTIIIIVITDDCWLCLLCLLVIFREILPILIRILFHWCLSIWHRIIIVDKSLRLFCFFTPTYLLNKWHFMSLLLSCLIICKLRDFDFLFLAFRIRQYLLFRVFVHLLLISRLLIFCVNGLLRSLY